MLCRSKVGNLDQTEVQKGYLFALFLNKGSRKNENGRFWRWRAAATRLAYYYSKMDLGILGKDGMRV